MPGPPDALVRSLVDGPSIVTQVEWFEQCDSTNAITAQRAAAGASEGLLVGAEEQTAGRGRHGRSWVAPAGTSLLFSVLLRPVTPRATHRLLPLLTGLVLAETLSRHLPDVDVALKWPNDLLLDGRKTAGILAETVSDGVVVGVGVNVDWRGMARPAELSEATSVAEQTRGDVDRWRLLAGILGVLSRRYDQWQELPAAFLDGYRQRCATLGRRVRVETLGGASRTGVATGIGRDGALELSLDDGTNATVHEGDVHHLRDAG